MRRIAILILLVASCASYAQLAPISGTCTQGGTQATVQGLKSTNYLQGIVPSCLVTPYLANTSTLASYSLTPTGNLQTGPFTANAASSVNPGGWIFYAAPSVAYDVVLSGGIPPNAYANPVTVPSVVACLPGTSCTVNGSGFPPSGTASLACVGDSRAAGANTFATIATHFPPAGVHVTTDPIQAQDICSDLWRQPNFNSRVPLAYLTNGATGGTNCAQMTTNYTAYGTGAFAPGGASAPLATTGFLVILTGFNDAFAGTSLLSYQNCMSLFLENAVTAGWTPLVLTSYYGSGQAPAVAPLLNSYNEWLRTISGWNPIPGNPTAVKVIDIDAQFPWSSSGPNYTGIVQTTNVAYQIASYTVASNVMTVTLTAGSPGQLHWLCIGTPAQGCYPNLQFGFFTGSLASLNYVRGTYVGGSTVGNTFQVQLATSQPNTTSPVIVPGGNGYVYSIYQPNPGGIHFGADGINREAQYVNEAMGPGGFNSSRLNTITTQDFYSPDSGQEYHADAFCVDGTTIPSSTATCNNLGAPGTGYFATQDENGVPAGSGYLGANSIVYLGKHTYLRVTPSAFIMNAPQYTGPAGAVGQATVGSSGGSGWAVNDTFLINCGSTNPVGQVLAISGTGTTGPATQLGIVLNQGGAGCSVMTNATTTAQIPSTGTGLTVNTQLSSSQPIFLDAPGIEAQGGSFYDCGAQVPCPVNDLQGNIGSFTGGAIISTGMTAAARGQNYLNGDVVNIVETGASGGQASVNGVLNGAVAAFNVTAVGSGYSVSTCVATTGGSGTGLTVNVNYLGALVIATGGVTLCYPGSGYLNGDVVGVTGGTGGQLTVTSAVNGAAAAVNFVAGGKLYTNSPPGSPFATTGGTGTGLTVTVLGINTNAGTLILGSGSDQIVEDSTGPVWTLSTGPLTVNNRIKAQSFTATAAAATVTTGQIGYGATTVANTFCGTLAGSAGCIVVNIAGTMHYVPYW